MLLWQALTLTLISFVVGALGGFVGLALGTMRLPAMLLMGIQSPVAAGTNILISSLASLTGALRHYREGRVDRRIVMVMGVPSFAGALVGGFASDVAPEGALVFLVGLLVLWQGVEFLLLFSNRRHSDRIHTFGTDLEGSSGIFSPNRTAIGSCIGLSVGLLGGTVGLILGSIRLPAIIRILRVDPRIAVGTNMFIGFFMGSLGWIGHAARGQVDYSLLLIMGTAAMAGSYIGSRFTGRVPLNTLILVIGVILLAVGAFLVGRGATL